jgi:hypothetical protein
LNKGLEIRDIKMNFGRSVLPETGENPSMTIANQTQAYLDESNALNPATTGNNTD